MPVPTPTAVPPDLALWADFGLAVVGSCPGAVVTLVPYPESRRYWVRVEWLWTGGQTTDSRTYAPGELMLWLIVMLARNGIDAGVMIWEPDFDIKAAGRNPFTGG